MKISETVPTSIQENSAVSAARPKWLFYVLLGLAAVASLLLIAKFVFSLNIVGHLFNFPFQLDESEGMLVAEVHLMDSGLNLYAQPNTTMFISAPYPPLYYLLVWPLQHFTGVSFKPGRAVSLLASFGIAVVLYKLVLTLAISRTNAVTKKFGYRLVALATAFFWATLGLVAFWGNAVKPDITAVFFDVVGLLLIARWCLKSKPQAKIKFSQSFRLEILVYVAALFFALAVLTKQTSFAGAAAAFVFLFVRKPATALRFIVIWLLLAFGPMLAMNVLSGGGYWWHNVTVHQLPWQFENYWKFTFGFIQSYQIFVLLALAYVLLYLVGLIKNLRQKFSWNVFSLDAGLLAILYLGSGTLQGFSVGTYGGNHNHLLEMAAAMCLGAGLTLAQGWQWWQARQSNRWQVAALPLALLLLIVQGLGAFVGEGQVKPENFPVLGNFGLTQAVLSGLRSEFNNPDWLTLQYRVLPAGYTANLEHITSVLTNVSGPVYSDNVSLVLNTFKPLTTTDPFTQTHATFYGRWNEAGLLAMINQHFFAAIAVNVTDHQCDLPSIYISPGLATAIQKNYDLKYRDTECIFEPK